MSREMKQEILDTPNEVFPFATQRPRFDLHECGFQRKLGESKFSSQHRPRSGVEAGPTAAGIAIVETRRPPAKC